MIISSYSNHIAVAIFVTDYIRYARYSIYIKLISVFFKSTIVKYYTSTVSTTANYLSNKEIFNLISISIKYLLLSIVILDGPSPCTSLVISSFLSSIFDEHCLSTTIDSDFSNLSRFFASSNWLMFRQVKLNLVLFKLGLNGLKCLWAFLIWLLPLGTLLRVH